MRVLIITDDVTEWLQKIMHYFAHTTYKQTEHTATITNQFVEIFITDSAEMRGRSRYTNIIIDKFVNDELLEQIKAHQIHGVVYTGNYYEPIDYNGIFRGRA